jgi:hypothetical protein
MPRVTLPLAIALGLAALSGCGGHRAAAPAHTARSTPAPAPSPAAKARALAVAQAINLTASDVPGFKASREHASKSRAERLAEGDLFRCAGARHGHRAHKRDDLADASSARFELKQGIVDVSVSSEVGVARSAALAHAELAVLHSKRVRRCFVSYLREVLSRGKPAGTRVAGVRIQSGNPPAKGAAGSFGWRVSATFGVGRVSVPVYLDMLGFVYGPARVTLISSGALRPFPAFAQQRLYELLLQRARAHPL